MAVEFLEWSGSEDSKAGTAHFRVGGEEFAFDLPEFAIAHRIGHMLRLARDEGEQAGVCKVVRTVCNAFPEVDC